VTHHRPERIADLIRQVLARLLREELRDPRIGFVTVTDVTLSPDLRQARVFVSTLDEDPTECLRALAGARPFLRRMLARESALRFTPELRFEIDESVAGGFRIERILEDVRPADREDDAAPAEAVDEDEP
jgi:ribosome-binding factor A